MKRGCCLVLLLGLTVGNALAGIAHSERANFEESHPMQVIEGYVTAADGVRLYFQKVGRGKKTVVIPNGFYLIDDFKQLTKDRTMVFFDLRNRGHSDTVIDDAKLKGGVHNDVEDIEAVRRYFDVEKIDLIAHSYVGVVVALYAMKYPDHVNRLVQIGPPQANMTKQYPPSLSNLDATAREVFTKMTQMQSQGAVQDPVESCQRAWSILRPLYVFDPADAPKLSRWGFCELVTERNMMRYFTASIMPTLQSLNISDADYSKAAMPVLTIHGTKDRNASYGGGRDWAMSLPNARLITVNNAAHVPWVEAPELVFGSIETFLNGKWPDAAEKVESLIPTNNE